GTWHLIFIARLRDPSTRSHEVSDNLGSFFWILLYLVVKCGNPEKALSKENTKASSTRLMTRTWMVSSGLA
ncbi:hypothetical protein EDB92DRAFT_1788359, partial [Lactarius akahatsu]